MKPGLQSPIRIFQPLALILLLVLLPPCALAQQKKLPAPAPAPKPAPAPAPKPAPKPASGGDPSGAPAAKPADKTSTGGTSGGKTTNSTNTTKNATAKGANNSGTKSTGGAPGTNRTNTKTNNRTNSPGTTNSRADANATTIKVVTPNSAGSARTDNSTAAPGGKPGAAGSAGKVSPLKAARANNQPGTHPLPNGGTRTVRSNGSAVERNKAAKVTAVTTSKGITAKLDAHGHPAALHDGHGTAISRGPHGERRIETVRADRSRLVSTGRHSGFVEHHFSRNGQEFARRTYYDHGHYYARVFQPYYYGGYPYFLFVPPFYFGQAYYGWAYNAWPSPVIYPWGWYGAPWFAPYGYYFTPYPVYPAPAFWLTDYAIAASLQAGAEETDSGSLQRESGFVLASAHPDDQKKDAAPVVMTQELKDQIAKQVKLIIASEKAAAAAQGNLPRDENATEQVPPSLELRFTIFIASSSATLETDDGACALTAGDIVQRSEVTPDADSTVAVEVVSSKNADCPVGTASRIALDDLEEMHDSFRQKIDDGLKSLSETQGKSGIPSGPSATHHPVPDGQADADPTVEADLKKQQEAADGTEKDFQDATPESGSAD